MNRKILFLGKERDAHFDFPFISCWMDRWAAGKKEEGGYVLCSWVGVYSSAVIHFGGLKVQIDPTTCTAMTLSDRGNKINE